MSEKDIKDNILFCSALETNTRPFDVIKKFAAFFDQEGLDWENVYGLCFDDAPALLGARSGLQTLVCSRSPETVSIDCITDKPLHRKLLQNLFKVF